MQRAIGLVLLILLLAACDAIPQSGAQQPPRRANGLVSMRPEVQRCMAGLGQDNADFTPLPDAYHAPGCRTLGTVQLASIRSERKTVPVSNLGPVTCPLAQTFAGWARFGVDRAARQILGSPLARIETLGSYNCRAVAGTERLSAHASANAIDVSGFVLEDGRRITVLGAWTGGKAEEREFLRIVRDSACKRFATVLSPDYNAAHRNHFHLEPGGRGFCR